MIDNLRHWDALRKTDPKHTKPFQRAGGFKGTATKPIWLTMRLTEHFGPAGIGWGMDMPHFETIAADGEILVFCTVALWYHDPASTPDEDGYRGRATVYGVGGDKVLVKRSGGTFANDEAFKAAYTDALSNAMKQIGVGADIHMGLFDDSKYVNAMREEFTEGTKKTEAAPKTEPPSDKLPSNGKSARAVTEAHAGRFELLFPNGELLHRFETPAAWCEGLRDAIKQDGAQVLGLWETNRPLAISIEERYPTIMWDAGKGRQFHAIRLIETKVRQMTNGLAA